MSTYIHCGKHSSGTNPSCARLFLLLSRVLQLDLLRRVASLLLCRYVVKSEQLVVVVAPQLSKLSKLSKTERALVGVLLCKSSVITKYILDQKGKRCWVSSNSRASRPAAGCAIEREGQIYIFIGEIELV
jgi:hypothetical protein